MKYRVKLGQKIYEVEVEQGDAKLLSEYDAVSAPQAPATPVLTPAPVAAPTAAPVSASQNAVTAPLPGKVVEVRIAVGQKVKRGDTVMIIEAMKMENEISAPKDGTITGVFVQKGAKVEQGAPIYEIN